MPPLPKFVAPKTATPRPPLPLEHTNPHIKQIDESRPPQVKYQIITREGYEIIVGRIKIVTPDGHAFVLRRFDTDAISLTTMFRAAFPTANEEAEKAECNWVKANYDITGANGGTGRESAKLRLAGTWVTPEVALSLADSYALGPTLRPLCQATPDPASEYRKSTKNGGSSTPNSSPVAPTPAKRRKEASPAPSTAALAAVQTPVSNLRRSARTKSPAPKSALAVPSKPKSAKKQQVATPAGSDETAVEDEPEVPGPDREQDIAEQKELIQNLKAQRGSTGAKARAEKRKGVEDEPLRFDFDKEPEIGERAIATNKRIIFGPQRKSAAWGVAFFAAGLGAMTLLPTYFPNLIPF